MRIEVSRGDSAKVIEVPTDVDIAGVMIKHGGLVQGSVLQFKAEDVVRREEEIFNDGTAQVIAFYYRSLELAEIMKAFVGFEEMTCIDVREGDCHVCIIV